MCNSFLLFSSMKGYLACFQVIAIMNEAVINIHLKVFAFFSCLVVSNSLWPHELHYNGLPHPSPFSRVCSNSCPLRWWYHPTISSSVVPFSSCPQSFLASESFPMSQLFASCDQSISASASVLPMNIQGWFLLGLTCLISLLDLVAVQDSQESSPTPQFKNINSLALSLPYRPTNFSSSHV